MAHKYLVKSLSVDRLRSDGQTQSRIGLDQTTVADYAEHMKAGCAFPPCIVFFDGTFYWLADGFHRIAAARSAGLSRISCEVRKGTKEDAQWFSVAANRTHGLRRTNADKRRAVELALKHRKGLTLSDGAVAEHCGVSRFLVATVRSENEPTRIKCESSVRVGVDGRTIDTSHIGRVRAVEPVEAVYDAPPDPPRRAARGVELCDFAEPDRPKPEPCRNCGTVDLDEDGDCAQCREPAESRAADPFWSHTRGAVFKWAEHHPAGYAIAAARLENMAHELRSC